jgi:hypothetical protein
MLTTAAREETDMPLKIFATLAGFVAFGAGLYIISLGMEPADQRDRPMTIAFGPATASAVELEVGVTDLIFKDADPIGRDSPWPNVMAWTDAHIEVVDATGKKLTWRRSGHASYMKGPTAGLCDSFMLFEITPGATYTLKFTPYIADGVTWAADFVAPTSDRQSQQQLALAR